MGISQALHFRLNGEAPACLRLFTSSVFARVQPLVHDYIHNHCLQKMLCPEQKSDIVSTEDYCMEARLNSGHGRGC